MAHAMWKGTVAFGLVTIPVKVYSAIRTNELHFHFLHKEDEGRIQNVRRCSLDGKDVSYQDIVRGYEYEDGQYVLLGEEDFERMRPEATQTVEIIEFVNVAEIDPIYFDTPYYLEPEKHACSAYALLREALTESGKVGIARVVLRSREHLAALKPDGLMLTLELMHFADEIVEQSEFDLPKREKPADNEMKIAKMLINAMTASFDPEKFHDSYREDLLQLIHARASGKKLPKVPLKPVPSTRSTDLMDLLRESLERSSANKPRLAREASRNTRRSPGERTRTREPQG